MFQMIKVICGSNYDILVKTSFCHLNERSFTMVIWLKEQNAEARRRGGAELIEESLIENKITDRIIAAAIEVHKTLGGPGLLESIYEDALAYELELRKMQFKRQLAVPVLYKGVPVRDALKLDLLVENRVIIEIKATEKIFEVHSAQLLTYLRLSNLKLGLVLNFGQSRLCDGISRIVNHL
jgi:GxxExxY protein